MHVLEDYSKCFILDIPRSARSIRDGSTQLQLFSAEQPERLGMLNAVQLLKLTTTLMAVQSIAAWGLNEKNFIYPDGRSSPALRVS